MPSPLRPRPLKAVIQFSFIDALVAGLLDGAFLPGEVQAEGDFGVGCGDALDGELVLIDGELFACRGDGRVERVDATERLPFAEVVRFEPTLTQTVSGLTKGSFERFVDRTVPSDNLFYAIRVDGEFDRMTVREAVRQQKPFPGLADAVREQRESSIGASRGSLIGFKGPDVFQGLSVADLHLHYLDDARAFGGHALDFELREGTVSIEAFSSFTVRLPQVDSYLDAELDDMEADAAIRQAENGGNGARP